MIEVEESLKIERNLAFFAEDLLSDEEMVVLLLNPLVQLKSLSGELIKKIQSSFDGEGRLLLHRLCLSEKLIHYLQLLFEKGINCGLVDKEKNSLLHYAAKSPFGAEILKQLKVSHLLLNGSNQNGLTPLQLAVLHRQHKVMQMLLKMGADPFRGNSEGVNLFQFIDALSQTGDYEAARKLVYDFYRNQGLKLDF